MPREYNKFYEQNSFIGGENRDGRDRMTDTQVSELHNVQIRYDRVYKTPGYTRYGALSLTNGSTAVMLLPDKVLTPANLWVASHGGNADALYRISLANGNTQANYAITSGNSAKWTGLAVGGSSGTPEAVLVSTGSLANVGGIAARIYDLSNVAAGPVAWSTGSTPALTSMEYYDGRLWGVNSTDANVYYSEVRSSWAADLDDWNYLTIGATTDKAQAVDNTFISVIGTALFVFKDKGIYRVEYAGGPDLYKQVAVSEEDGCQYVRGWVRVREGRAVVYYDRNEIKLFDGNQTTVLTTNLNIRDTLAAVSPTDVSMAYDEVHDVVRVRLYFASASTYGWDIFLDQWGDTGPAFAKQTTNDKVRVQEYVKVNGATTYMLGATKLFTETASTYTHNDTAYESYVTFRPLDLAMTSEEKYPVLRQVKLDVSADYTLHLTVKHRKDTADSWTVTSPVRVATGKFQNVIRGINRPGKYSQVQVSDGQTTSGWSLRRAVFSGYRKGIR